MPPWVSVAYSYDGSFAGFLTCVFESYLRREAPACFLTPEDPRISLWPEREVETDRGRALRVYRSLDAKIGPGARTLVSRGFLTCLPQRELRLWEFLRLGYARGPEVLLDLAEPRVHVLSQAVRQLNHEAHLYTGFVRFSEQAGVLVAGIDPKNRVLPLLRPHFCARFSHEQFVIHDAVHREALFHRPGRWAILPVDSLRAAAPGEEELAFRRLWRRFYDAVAIRERYNPRCRMTQMPKRYWSRLTELREEDAGGAPPLPGENL